VPKARTAHHYRTDGGARRFALSELRALLTARGCVTQNHDCAFRSKAISVSKFITSPRWESPPRAGRWRDAICPFHTDTRPSLRSKPKLVRSVACLRRSCRDVLAFICCGPGGGCGRRRDLEPWCECRSEHPRRRRRRHDDWLAPYSDGNVPDGLHLLHRRRRSRVVSPDRAKHPVSGEKWGRPMHRMARGTTWASPRFPNGKKPLYRLPGLRRLIRRCRSGLSRVRSVRTPRKLGQVAINRWRRDFRTNGRFEPLRVERSFCGPIRRTWRATCSASLRSFGHLGCTVETVEIRGWRLSEKGTLVDYLAAHPDATGRSGSPGAHSGRGRGHVNVGAPARRLDLVLRR